VPCCAFPSHHYHTIETGRRKSTYAIIRIGYSFPENNTLSEVMNPIKMIAFDLFGVIFSEGHLISNVLMRLLPARCQKSQVKTLYEEFGEGRWLLLMTDLKICVRHTNWA